MEKSIKQNPTNLSTPATSLTKVLGMDGVMGINLDCLMASSSNRCIPEVGYN